MSCRIRVSASVFGSETVETVSTVELSTPSTLTNRPPSELPEPSAAIQEVLGYPARWIADLPLATTLLVSRAHGGGHLLLTTSRTAYAACQAARVPAFVGFEVTALGLAAEHGRATAQVLEGWCASKLAYPFFRLTPESAVDLPEIEPHRNWTVGQVLRAYGAELVSVCTGSEVPPL